MLFQYDHILFYFFWDIYWVYIQFDDEYWPSSFLGMIVAKEIADHASWYNPSLWSYGDDVVRTLHGLTTKYPPDPTSNIQQLYPKSVWYTVNREHSNLIPHVCESLYIMIWVCSKTNGYQQKRWFIIITFLGRIVLFQLNPHII